MGHMKKQCMEKPRAVGAKYSNTNIVPDDNVLVSLFEVNNKYLVLYVSISSISFSSQISNWTLMRSETGGMVMILANTKGSRMSSRKQRKSEIS